MKIKKKMVCFLGIIIVLSACFIIYFQPMSLSNTVSENNRIVIMMSEIGVRNGEAYIDSTDNQNITKEQKNSIIALFNKYSYRRTFGTFFSNGSLTGIGDRLIYIYVYDNTTTLVANITISSSGKVVIGQKTYTIEKADDLIDQVIDILDLQ